MYTFRGQKNIKGGIFMPRNARKDLNTSFFHVITQGINKEYIFESTEYKNKYFRLLKKSSINYNVKIVAYCIMSNHAHLLIYADNSTELSNFMKEVNENYARYYNYKQGRVGYVFRNRFLSEPIYSERYLRNCMVYIHNNPVKAKIVKKCEDYMFSSYQDYIKRKNFVNDNLIKLVFNTIELNMEEYRKMHLKEFYFLDYKNTTIDNIKEIAEEYKKQYKKNPCENMEELIYYIKQNINTSNRKIAKSLGIDRNKVDRILSSNNSKRKNERNN